MNVLNKTAANIEALIDSWRPQLLDLDENLAKNKPSADRWAIAEVIGHLVDSACNNHQRFVRAQFCSELEFPKYEQNQWANAGTYLQSDWKNLVQLFYYYNKQIAVMIRNLPETKLSTPCTITPYETCTLEFLVTDYLTHLEHHFTKISERINNTPN